MIVQELSAAETIDLKYFERKIHTLLIDDAGFDILGEDLYKRLENLRCKILNELTHRGES